MPSNSTSNSMVAFGGTAPPPAPRPKLALKEHRAIVNAIAQKNPDLAEQAAREHIRAAHQARASMMLGQN